MQGVALQHRRLPAESFCPDFGRRLSGGHCVFGGILDRLRGKDGNVAQEEPGRTTTIPAGVMTLGNTNFTWAIKQYPLTVVDFWAPWCAPCKAISPVVEQLSRSYAGRVAFGKVNVDKEKWVASSFRIKSVPTIMLFSRGHTVDRVTGVVPKPVLDSKIARHLGLTKQ